jgi:hypothetical protein
MGTPFTQYARMLHFCALCISIVLHQMKAAFSYLFTIRIVQTDFITAQTVAPARIMVEHPGTITVWHRSK